VTIEEAIEELESGGAVRFSRLLKICEEFFGEARIRGSHHIFRTPWVGNPRINLQADGPDAKRYQVRQVIEALERLEESGDE